MFTGNLSEAKDVQGWFSQISRPMLFPAGGELPKPAAFVKELHHAGVRVPMLHGEMVSFCFASRSPMVRALVFDLVFQLFGEYLGMLRKEECLYPTNTMEPDRESPGRGRYFYFQNCRGQLHMTDLTAVQGQFEKSIGILPSCQEEAVASLVATYTWLMRWILC